ncbi:TraR/DksA C4-type zinc finger protein [Alteribacter natronophilus]|uniref:TraR/DksA C4-type zinc finger protein n=1 Tax=Alteribacter natronophilus TaxID=2583810 RepID=UPI00148746C6|nr:TraR/DksA C4-type zinc finger protein [Alteribacter natronophilus]
MITQEQINILEEKLLEMKEDHKQRLAGEETETDSDKRPEDTGEISNYDNHPGDQATELFEREKDAAINNHARHQLNEVKNALEAIEEGEYGKCEVCGDPIPFERLEIVPESVKCVEHAEEASRDRDRPVEEEIQRASLEDDSKSKERVAFDREDAWESVSDHGSSQSPSDFVNSERQYNNPKGDSENDSGVTEEVDDVPVSDIEGNDTGRTSSRKEHEGGSGSSSDLEDDPKKR